MPEFLVYISCVGEQDPVSERTDEEGALLTCFRYLTEVQQLHLNAAYFIPTSRTFSPERHTEERAEKCARIIRESFPDLQIAVVPLEVKNPADLKQVYPKMREILKSIVSEVKNQAQDATIVFHINVSSGTPQMKESMPFLVSTGHLDPHEVHLWQVFDPRGGAKEISARVQPAPELDLLSQERILLRLEQLAKQHMYQEANGWLKRGLTMDYIDFAKQLYRVLAEHDQWLYRSACSGLKRMLSLDQVPDFLRDWLNEVSNWLSILAQDQPPKNILAIDRYYCACRRLANGLYPDVVNHSWTACELALKKHGEDLRVLKSKKSPPAFKLLNQLAQSGSPLTNQIVQLKGHLPRPLLAIEDVSNQHQTGATNWLRLIRNEVEHGLQPVTQQLAENAREIAKAVLEALGWGQEMQSCPLRPELVQEKLLQLIQAMRDSLWR